MGAGPGRKLERAPQPVPERVDVPASRSVADPVTSPDGPHVVGSAESAAAAGQPLDEQVVAAWRGKPLAVLAISTVTSSVQRDAPRRRLIASKTTARSSRTRCRGGSSLIVSPFQPVIRTPRMSSGARIGAHGPMRYASPAGLDQRGLDRRVAQPDTDQSSGSPQISV